MRRRWRGRSFAHSHCPALVGGHEFYADAGEHPNPFRRADRSLRKASEHPKRAGAGATVMNNSWIEPPPPQRGMGCFGKGCLILFCFLLLLVAAFAGGSYLAVRYLR